MAHARKGKGQTMTGYNIEKETRLVPKNPLNEHFKNGELVEFRVSYYEVEEIVNWVEECEAHTSVAMATYDLSGRKVNTHKIDMGDIAEAVGKDRMKPAEEREIHTA